MEKSTCLVCQKPKATLVCGICQGDLCKYCAQILDEGQFSYLPQIPAELSYATYCGPCFDLKVAGDLQKYNETLKAAKEVLVFFKTQSKETRLIKRNEAPLKVNSCADEEEALMRLAFLAVQAGCNGVIDIEVSPQKIRTGSYQTTTWSATGLPAKIKSHRY